MGFVAAECDDCGTEQAIDIDGWFFAHKAACGGWCGGTMPKQPGSVHVPGECKECERAARDRATDTRASARTED